MKFQYKYILPLVFFLLLLTPRLLVLFGNNTVDETKENRKLTEKPNVDWRHLDRYPKLYNAYFNDHFGFRKTGLKLYNRFNYFFLKKSPVPDKAILGKDYWIYKGEDIDIFRGKKRFSEEEINLLEDKLSERDQFLSEKNCQLMIVLIPMKKEIYPEYVPHDYYRISSNTSTDQFIDMIRTKTNIEILDFRKTLKAYKKEFPILYHKHDNHWNDIGAHFVYQGIMSELNKNFELDNALKMNQYSLDTIEWGAGSLAKVLGVEDVISGTRINMIPNFTYQHQRLPKKYNAPKRFPYEWAYERRYETPDTTKPRLMVVHDSFGEYLHPFLAEHFSYSLFLFDNWEYNLHIDKIKQENPDVFIMCMVESLIPNLLKSLDREENRIEPQELVNK